LGQNREPPGSGGKGKGKRKVKQKAAVPGSSRGGKTRGSNPRGGKSTRGSESTRVTRSQLGKPIDTIPEENEEQELLTPEESQLKDDIRDYLAEQNRTL
jgi:hypothetical protein